MMTSLLQFFLKHQCIYRTDLLYWYNEINVSRYEGLDEAKKLAKPFIQSLSLPPIGKILFLKIQPILLFHFLL